MEKWHHRRVAETNTWTSWEQLRKSPDPDPIEVLRAVSAFQRYFAAIEREAINVARSQDRTWDEIGAALGRTRQAVWQRVDSRSADSAERARWREIRRAMEGAWAQSAAIRHEIGLPPG
jgi:hypothetical protein